MLSVKKCGLAVLVILLTSCAADDDQQQPATMDLGQAGPNGINIIVRCQGQQADIALVPWRRALDGGGTVTFNLRGGANSVSAVTIEPKDPNDLNVWPFSGSVINVSTAQSATTPPAPTNPDDVVHSYSVRASCAFPAQGPNTMPGPRDVILDPDLIVRGSGAQDSL